MAKALDELGDDGYFIDQFGDRADTHARFSYYPPCARPDLVFGLRPHSDGTFLSLLMLDDSVGGLQVFRDGVWYDVRAHQTSHPARQSRRPNRGNSSINEVSLQSLL